MRPAKLQAVLLGGAFIGILSSLPYIEAGNLCCCLWIVLGGVLTSYVLQENHPAPITVGDGAVGGLLAGLLGAILSTGVSQIFKVIRGVDRQTVLDEAMASMPDARMREMVEMMKTISEPAWLAIEVVSMMLVGLVFATAGGAIGAVIFRRNQPPVPPTGPLEPPPLPPPPPPMP